MSGKSVPPNKRIRRSLGVAMDEDMYAAVDAIAEARCVNVTVVIRELVSLGLITRRAMLEGGFTPDTTDARVALAVEQYRIRQGIRSAKGNA